MLQPLLLGLGAASLALWLGVLLHPARPWTLRPVAEDEPAPPELAAWPPVAVLVPARNEAAYLPRTLSALVAQDYPGRLAVVVVDDRSEDETRRVAAVRGVEVVAGEPLPPGWVGKVWALEQGFRATPRDATFVLVTDADILHAPGSVRRLVAEAEAERLDLVSRMARLRTASAAERFLIPPFLYFFNLLYPMPWATSGRRPAAAGGCVLLRREALLRAGGFEAIRGEVIDDLNLARRLAGTGGRVQLALSRSDVVSRRAHDSVAGIWAMVARTAYTELGRSPFRLAAALATMAVMFPLPPLLVAAFAASAPAGALGLLAWLVMTGTFLPAVRFSGVRPAWALTLPASGVLFAAMTLSSARAHHRRARE